MDVKLDPLTTVVRLALINFKPGHVKVGITASGVLLFNDSWFDRSRRTLHHWLGNGCSREFLYALRPPLQQAVQAYRSQYPELFELAHSGLELLKNNYSCSNVTDTLTLAMRTLRDPIEAPIKNIQRSWSDEEIQAVLVWMQLLSSCPTKLYLIDCIDLFLDGKANELVVDAQPSAQKIA